MRASEIETPANLRAATPEGGQVAGKHVTKPTKSHRPAALLLSSNYPPELGPAPRRGTLLTEALLDAGYCVTVVTWQPNHPQRRVWPAHRRWLTRFTVLENVEIVRVRPVIGPSRWLLARGLAELLSCLLMIGASFLVARRWNLVVATSPSMFLGPLGAFFARMGNVPFLWDVRDLTWEYASQVGGEGLIVRRLRRAMFRAADQSTMLMTTTEGQAEYFDRRVASARRAHCIPNPVDPEWLEDTRAVAAEYQGLQPSATAGLRVLYAGLLGFPQGLDVVLEAAAALADEHVTFVLAGDGPDAARLQTLVTARGLANVCFTGYLNQERLLEVFADAHICYAQLRDGGGFATAFPTKLLEYMAAGRPIVYGGGGHAGTLLQKVGCGLVVSPDSPDALVGAIRRLLASPELRKRLGAAGRRYATAEADYEATRAKLASLLRTLEADASSVAH